MLFETTYFSPLFFLRLRKWNLKTCMCSFPSYTFCIFTCLKFMKKHIYPSFHFHCFPSAHAVHWYSWIVLCVCYFYLLIYIFFLTGCGLFQDTKIKEAVDVTLLCFSCNQLASETHSFGLWPHSHWNQ